MLNLFHWGVFGEKLAESHESPGEVARKKYIEQRHELQKSLKKYPNARNTIRMIDNDNYRKYVRRMLEICGSEIISQFDDLVEN